MYERRKENDAKKCVEGCLARMTGQQEGPNDAINIVETRFAPFCMRKNINCMQRVDGDEKTRPDNLINGANFGLSHYITQLINCAAPRRCYVPASCNDITNPELAQLEELSHYRQIPN